ncbi:MAG: transposase [Microthrixaceae bacterium]
MLDGTRACEVLVGLDGVEILEVERVEGVLRITIRTRTTRAWCSLSGRIAQLKDHDDVELVDLSCFGSPVRLVWSKDRWGCSEETCPTGSFTEIDHRIASPRQRLTRQAGMWACRQVGEHGRTVAEVAADLGADWHTINNAVITWGAALLAADAARVGTPDAVGLDETLAVREGRFKTRCWCTGIVDVRAGQLLDLVAGRDSVGVIEWFRGQGLGWCSNIAFATFDLSGPYRAVFDTVCPDAIQVADPYHVVQLANRKLDAVRRRGQNDTLGHRGRTGDPLYRARKLMLLTDERVPEDRHSKLRGLLRAGDPDGEVYTAWAANYPALGGGSMSSVGGTVVCDAA